MIMMEASRYSEMSIVTRLHTPGDSVLEVKKCLDRYEVQFTADACTLLDVARHVEPRFLVS
jgi:hypothetical protein